MDRSGNRRAVPCAAGDGDDWRMCFSAGAASAGVDRSHHPGQDDPYRLSGRCAALFLKRQVRRACRLHGRFVPRVAKKLAEQLNLGSLNVTYVPVIAADRFEAIRQQKADLLCEPTSATLSRRELVDFSIPTFVDGASLMIRADGPHDLKAMAGSENRRACRHDDRAGVAELA